MSNLHKAVYIPSIEASDIYSNNLRGMEIKLKYVGMIPSSLELNKLIKNGFNTYKAKTSDKMLSEDIFNIKFRQKVGSADDVIQRIAKKIDGLNVDNKNEEKRQKTIQYKQKLMDFIPEIEKEKGLDKWQEINNDDLRKLLYVNGFVHCGHRYVAYKRSSAKSREGQCLFIKEHLYNDMIAWSRMDLQLDHPATDFPSLLAYESLVGSSLEGLIEIKPENILIIDDVESSFKQLCNVVRAGTDGFLDSFEENAEIKNSLFDGESILESSYFPEDKGMMLLRNHKFKSAAFSGKIQKFFKDHCPEGTEYEQWQLPTMFEGVTMYAKDVHLITTPSSLKALKFSHVLGSKIDMWNHWKQIVEADGSLFGVCKNEKSSRHGTDGKGNVQQQLSYQMVNCLPMSKEDIKDLTVFEREYIDKLKNNDDFFIEHIGKSVNSINSNAMLIDLYKRNKEIVRAKFFRDFRKYEINKHVTHIKNGKIRLVGDYCTMLGNGMEFLKHAIGQFDVNKVDPVLKGNEIYTTFFEFGTELIGFRNPNTSPSNVLVAKNTYNAEIEKYFNLSDNIVCVNAIKFPLQDILSGSDYDSDTLLLVQNSKLLELGKKCFGKYRVCINRVASTPKPYQITKEDMAVIDNQLATSQKTIGRVVNLGQLCMSTYWDLLTKGKKEKELKELLKKIDVMTVLSGICIDLAKKFYDINIQKEIRHVERTEELREEKPLFWKYVSQSKDVKTIKYSCPMDYLFEDMTGLKYAERRANMSLEDLLIKKNVRNGNRKQEKKIVEYVEAMCNKINFINETMKEEEEEKNIRVDDIIKFYGFYIAKLTVKPDTMCAILLKTANSKSKIAIKLMNVLYNTQTTNFLNAFVKQKVTRQSKKVLQYMD